MLLFLNTEEAYLNFQIKTKHICEISYAWFESSGVKVKVTRSTSLVSLKVACLKKHTEQTQKLYLLHVKSIWKCKTCRQTANVITECLSIKKSLNYHLYDCH